MFKLSSRGRRRIALVLGFLVLTVLSDSGARMNKHAGLKAYWAAKRKK